MVSDFYLFECNSLLFFLCMFSQIPRIKNYDSWMALLSITKCLHALFC